MINSGQFKKGHTPFNKGRKWTDYMPAKSIEKLLQTTFKKNELPPTAHEKGHITIIERTRKNGSFEVSHTINIDWRGNRKSKNSYKWYLWEVENQADRPTGMVLAIKNSNPYDIRPENLELISRKENLLRNIKNRL